MCFIHVITAISASESCLSVSLPFELVHSPVTPSIIWPLYFGSSPDDATSFRLTFHNVAKHKHTYWPTNILLLIAPFSSGAHTQLIRHVVANKSEWKLFIFDRAQEPHNTGFPASTVSCTCGHHKQVLGNTLGLLIFRQQPAKTNLVLYSL